MTETTVKRRSACNEPSLSTIEWRDVQTPNSGRVRVAPTVLKLVDWRFFS